MHRAFPFLLALGLGACAARVSLTERDHYVLFFTEWSAQLDAPARSIIAAAAEAAKASPGSGVRVEGFADQTGGTQANLDLSRTRAQVVVDELVADGVPAGRITRAAAGSVAPPAITSQASRRVDIVIGS